MIGLVLKSVLSKNFWLGVAVAMMVGGSYMIVIFGPQQYRAGGDRKALELTENTKEAAKGISDAAERARFERLSCVASGGVYDFARGECQR